jgi:branched-chain amino acid transport system substrate-binding protein
MSDDLHRDCAGADGRGGVSRRDFLKLAGVAGAALGVGAGLGGLVAACGETTATATTAAQTTTTAAQTATTAAETTTTAAAEVTTSVSAQPEMGEEIKVGFVNPTTGSLASLSVFDKYVLTRWRESVADGLVCGDGKKHPINFMLRDTQSDSNRAAQVAGDLINNDQVKFMMVATSPDTVNPVVAQCEANGTPVVSTDCPIQSYLGNNKEFKWAYHMSFGAEDAAAGILDMLGKVTTNKKAGLLFDNSADGNVLLPFYEAFLTAGGYECVKTSQFQPGGEDFTAQISAYKQAGCEVVTGNTWPPDFTNFWKQVAQQGLGVKACTIGKALLTPSSVNALGSIANGLMKELTWHYSWPWKSSLTGETCAQLADDFSARTGEQPTSPLLHHCLGEMAIYCLKNATDPTSKDALLTALESMKLETILGQVDFTAPLMAPDLSTVPPGPGHKTKNCMSSGLAGAQWQIRGGKYQFDEVPVAKGCAPFMLDSTIQDAIPISISGK